MPTHRLLLEVSLKVADNEARSALEAIRVKMGLSADVRDLSREEVWELEVDADDPAPLVDLQVPNLVGSGPRTVFRSGELVFNSREDQIVIDKLVISHSQGGNVASRSLGHIEMLAVELDGGGVATSGDYQRYTMVGDRRYHHVLDPSTGYPARGVMSVTVVAETAMDADALATAIFVMGPEHGMWLVEELPAVEAMMITGGDEIDEIMASSGLRGRFHAAE